MSTDGTRKNMRNKITAFRMSVRHLEKHDSAISSYESRENFWLEIMEYAQQRAEDIKEERIARRVERMNEAREAKRVANEH